MPKPSVGCPRIGSSSPGSNFFPSELLAVPLLPPRDLAEPQSLIHVLRPSSPWECGSLPRFENLRTS
eukprot:2083249-Amphidinium_carterae.1